MDQSQINTMVDRAVDMMGGIVNRQRNGSKGRKQKTEAKPRICTGIEGSTTSHKAKNHPTPQILRTTRPDERRKEEDEII